MTRISWLLIVPLALAAVSAPLACVESLSFEYKKPAATGGAGGAGGESSSTSSTTSSTSTSGMGGMGGSPECKTVNDCVVDECNPATACSANGVCIRQKKAANEPADSQLYGDCNARVCDKNGMIEQSMALTDQYDFKNSCYVKDCNAQAMPMPNNGAICETSWGNVNGICKDFQCIDCMDDNNCMMPNKCNTDGRCVPPQCADGVLAGDESDIDCGGTSLCPRCAPGKACMVKEDCDIACEGMVCVAPSCTDTMANGDETDVDCGGSCAAKCAAFKKCLIPNDCESGVCLVGQCAEPMCRDYTLNQGEEAIDCGGPNCPPCP